MNDDRILPAPGTSSAVTQTLLVDGNALPATFEVLSIVTEKDAGRIPRARVVLRDGDAAAEDFPLSNEPELVPGKELEIQAGYASEETTLFKGIIVKQRIQVRSGGSSTLVVECRDAAVKMTVGRKSRYFVDKTDGEVIEQLFGEHSLSVTVDATTPPHAELVQVRATDWDFVRSRADANGLVVLVDDGEVSVQAPDVGGSAAASILYGDTIFELDAEIDARHQFGSVLASAWDHATQVVREKEGAAPSAYPQGNLTEAQLAETIGLSALELRHSGRLDLQELQAWADAQLVKSSLSKIVGRASVQGLPDVKPGQVLELSGLGERFTGNAFVAAVRHEIVRGTWRTDLQFGLKPRWFTSEPEVTEQPAAGLLPSIHGLQIGVATKLEGDPDGEDRIQVRLPLIDAQADGTWARWLAPDAGAERGVFFRPEIDDEVIVGFLNGDPRDPVILGMVHSSAHPAPIAAADTNHEKGIVTRSGMRLHFDDETSIATVDTPGGNSIVVSDDEQAITLTDQHGNFVKLDSDGITLKGSKITLDAQQEVQIKAGTSLKAEGGTNAEIKAGAQFKAEGSAGANLETSAIATIKGSLVKIN